MTPRARMALAMRHREPDRVPVMCQLALGHYFLQAGLDPVDVWHDTPAFADALVRLQQRYGFDGILVNLPGREPEWRRHVAAAERCLGEAMAGGGYVLSTACSVAPASPPENILQIRAAAEAAGRYARTR